MSRTDTAGHSGNSADAGFDPASVPPYPLMRVVTSSGAVTLNGEEIESAPGRSALDVAIATIARRAASSNSRAVRVLVVDEGGHEFWHVVDAEGSVHDLRAGQQRPDAARVQRRRRLGVLLAAAGMLVVLLATAGIAFIVRSSRQRVATAAATHTVTVAPSPTATQLPALQVPGWSSIASWGSDPVASVNSSDPAAAIADDKVFAVLGSDSSTTLHLAQLSVTSGATDWSVKISGSQVQQGPVVATIGGHQTVLVATDSKVSAVDLATHAVQSWAVPQGSSSSTVLLTSAGPVITTSSTSASIVDGGGNLTARSLPAGAIGWAPLPGLKLLAVDAAGHVWRSGNARVAGAAATLKGPKKTVGAGTVAVTDHMLVQQWSPAGDDGSGTVVLSGYTMPGLKPAWTTASVPAADPSQMRAFGEWLWTGSVLVDSLDGRVVRLPDGADVIGVDHGTVWATINGDQLATYDTNGHVEQPPSSQADASANSSVTQAYPVGFVGQQLLVSASADSSGTLRLYLLPADAQQTTAAPSSTLAPRPPSTPAKKPSSSKHPSSDPSHAKKKR